MKTQRSCSIWCVARLSFVIVCLSSLAESGSINRAPMNFARSNERDPMLALPSDEGRRQYDHQLQVSSNAGGQPAQEVHYVTYQQAQPVAEYHHPQQQQQVGNQEVVVEYQAPAQADQQQQQPQQVLYSRPQYQLVQVSLPQAQAQAGGQRQQREEQGASNEQAGVSGDYPGEIIYIGQNGEAIGDQQGQQQQQAGSLSSVANSLAQNSGLSATILTEVPVKDMPAEVLNKLRREYGVKVVATRERPGANLVINCEEHPSAGQESSICNKQQPPTYEYHQGHPSEHNQHHHSSPAGYSVEHELAAQVHGHEGYHHHVDERGVVDELLHNEPYHHSQQQPSTSAMAGHEQGGDNGPATGPPADQQPNTESEYYGSRTTVAAGPVEQPTESADSYEGRSADQTNRDNSATISHEHASLEHTSHEPAPSSAAAHEGVDQSSGFDEQPKSDAAAPADYSHE